MPVKTVRSDAQSSPDIHGTLMGGGEMGNLMRSQDWTGTALGPIESWPRSLLTATGICLNSRFPMLIFWGDDLNVIYNDSFASMTGSKHSKALGLPCREYWPEIWGVIGLYVRYAPTGEDLEALVFSEVLERAARLVAVLVPRREDRGEASFPARTLARADRCERRRFACAGPRRPRRARSPAHDERD